MLSAKHIPPGSASATPAVPRGTPAKSAPDEPARKRFQSLTPASSIALQICGALAFVGGVLACLGEEVAIGVSSILASFFWFALSAVVEYLAEIAFQSRRSADALEELIKRG